MKGWHSFQIKVVKRFSGFEEDNPMVPEYAGSKSRHITLWLRGEAELVWGFGVLGFLVNIFYKVLPPSSDQYMS